MKRIFLVDDDTSALQALEKLLRLDGFEVHLTHDPADALVVLGQQRFDVVMSDLDMPAVDGLRVLAAAREAQPNARRILATGNTRARASLPEGVTLMCKPIDYDDLLLLLAA